MWILYPKIDILARNVNIEAQIANILSPNMLKLYPKNNNLARNVNILARNTAIEARNIHTLAQNLIIQARNVSIHPLISNYLPKNHNKTANPITTAKRKHDIVRLK